MRTVLIGLLVIAAAGCSTNEVSPTRLLGDLPGSLVGFSGDGIPLDGNTLRVQNENLEWIRHVG